MDSLTAMLNTFCETEHT